MKKWTISIFTGLAGPFLVAVAAWAAGGRITGQVIDAETQTPLAGANIWLVDTPYGATADENGHYELQNVPAGTYSIRASMTGYAAQVRQQVAIPESNPVAVDFTLPLKLARMKEVVVTATRLPRMVRDVPVNTSVLTGEDLARSTARKVDDILRLTPGIDIDRPAGLLYTSPSVSMRGMGGRTAEGRTLVLLDGVPVNDSYTGGVAWNSFSTADIERIEVVRGAGSALYGSNAMGGIVNLITRGWTRQSRTTARLSYATQNTPEAEVFHSGWLGRLGYSVNANYVDTDGYIVVPEENRKEYDQERTMEQKNIGGKLRWMLAPDVSLTLSADHYAEDANAGRPLYTGSSTQDRFNLNYSGMLGGLDWQGVLFAHFQDAEWTYDTGTLRDKIDYVSDQPKKQWGLSGRTTLDLLPTDKLTLALDYKWGQVETTDEYLQTVRQVEATGRQQTFGLSAENEFAPGDRLRLIAGARYDHVRTYDGSSLDTSLEPGPRIYPDKSYDRISPRIGVVYHPEEVTTLRASIGRAFQAPNLYNLYRTYKYYSTTYAGNPDLEPEQLTSYEVGADRTFGSWLLARLTFYRNDADDFIYSITTDVENKIKSKQNIGAVKMQGVEGELSAFPLSHVSLSAAYTFNESTIEEFAADPALEGKYLIYAPRHKVSFTIGYDDPRLLTADLTGRFVGERFTDDPNTADKALDSYITIDFKLSRKLGPNLATSLEATNLLGKDYEEKSGFVAPGRLFRVNLDLQR